MSHEERGLIPVVKKIAGGISTIWGYFDPNNVGPRPSDQHVLVEGNGGYKFWVLKEDADK